jgi:transposase
MHHLGIDVHSDYSKIQHMVEDGSLGYEDRIATDQEEICKFLDNLDEPVSVSFEAGRNYWAFFNMIKDHPKIAQIKVLDPRRSRKFSSELSVKAGYGRAKNDRIDAEMIAEQDRIGISPKIKIPSQKAFEERTLVRHRIDVIRIRTMMMCKIHSLLVMHGHDISKHEFLNNEQSREQAILSVPVFIQQSVRNYYSIVNMVNNQITELEKNIFKKIPDTLLTIKLILTIPGFGPILSRILYTEIWDINRFNYHTNLCSYSGLAPIVDESNGKKGVIKLNKHSNRYLKYAFILAAHHARRHPKFRKKYNKDAKKHGEMRAKINLARKLVKIVFWMLTRQQPFQG